MKNHPGHLIWVFALLLTLAGLMLASRSSPPDAAAVKALAECKQSLRAQGFKTELNDFDFSTTPEEQARAEILTNAITFLSPDARNELPPLLQPVGNDSAAVLWKSDSVAPSSRSAGPEDAISWDAYRTHFSQNQPQYDATATAILSGPLRFSLSVRPDGDLPLPHLAVIRNLTCAFAARSILALHDSDWDDAWTNLMAVTHLVTAREPEPEDASHSVRYADTTTAFDTLWQVLQHQGWEEKRLLQLQQDWEVVDFFTNLPLTESFAGCSSAAHQACVRTGPGYYTPGFREFAETVLRFPHSLVPALAQRSQAVDYCRHQSYADERDLLLYYRDRQDELRDAIGARNWQEMRSLPAVTNKAVFQPGRRGPFQPVVGEQEFLRGRGQTETGLLARAAQAEAQRRLMITALALERFHIRHGMYPKSLTELSPEFLKGQPVDFMDGQPLRYQLDQDGHFLLYSIGLDGVDNGGLMRRDFRDPGFRRPERPGGKSAEYDLVWPRPAGDSAKAAEKQIEVEAQQAQLKAKTWQQRHYLTEIADREWNESPSRQSRVAKILGINWVDAPEEPLVQGQKLGRFLGNPVTCGTNHPSTLALLKPRQIFTGNEPEDVTFEYPIRYEAIAPDSILFVVVDGNPDDEMKFDSGGKAYDLARGTNGDCLVIWHAIYDPPGQHAVQTYLALKDPTDGGTFYVTGPPTAVTTSNSCQFSLDCANYEIGHGARFHARLAQKHGTVSIECLSTNGTHLAALSGKIENGEFDLSWNLTDEHGYRLTGEPFNTLVQITSLDSGQPQEFRGPQNCHGL